MWRRLIGQKQNPASAAASARKMPVARTPPCRSLRGNPNKAAESAPHRLREHDGDSLLLVLLGPERSPDKCAVLEGAFEHDAKTRRPALSARLYDRVQENSQRRDAVPLTESSDKGVVYRVHATLARLDPFDAQVVRITRRYEAHLPAPPGRPTDRPCGLPRAIGSLCMVWFSLLGGVALAVRRPSTGESSPGSLQSHQESPGLPAIRWSATSEDREIRLTCDPLGRAC
jgi:hypothetical protein